MQDLKIYHIGICATPGTNNGLQRAFKKVSEYREIHTGHSNLNQQIIKDVSEFKPDIVFMQIQTPGVVHLETIRAMRPHCGKIINFTGDVREPLPYWYINTGKEIDLSLFVSMYDVDVAIASGIKAEWIQIGFDETIFNDKVTPIKSADIIFSANNYDHFPLSKYRQEIAYALREEFKDGFQLYGNGWKIPAIDSNASQEKQAAILRGCNIAVSCSNFNHPYYISDRVLRIMGSGTFCLSHNYEGYDCVYSEGENIVTFNSIDDMILLCRAYMNNDDERNRIAKNGMELTHSLYTWDSFVKNIIKLCE